MIQSLDPAYLERITKLAEECAEVIQVVTKIIRFGPESSSPVPHVLGQESNKELLENEINDVINIVHELLGAAGDISIFNSVRSLTPEKKLKLNKYLLHNKVK